MMSYTNELANSALKTARFIFFGIALQATFFIFWGQEFFISAETPPTGGVAIYFLFGFMGLVSFAYGFRFFQNYTRVHQAELFKQDPKKRKEYLLLITAIHFLLLEFVAIIGILLAIFVQKNLVIYPFYGLFIGGFSFSYPKISWYTPFFKDTHELAKV